LGVAQIAFALSDINTTSESEMEMETGERKSRFREKRQEIFVNPILGKN